MFIRTTPNPSGAYPAPQSNPFPGAVSLPDDMLAEFLRYKGFVHLVLDDDTVTAIEPNVEALAAWEAAQPNPINSVRESKLAELSNACNTTINAGTQVQLSDGSTESFTYGLVDQSNISEMFNAVLLGATEYPYHANDDNCRMYSAQDIMTIYVTLSSYKTAQTTYHNQLKQYVKAMESITEVEAVTYGQELTGIYLDKYNELMAQAKTQLDNIVAKVQSNEMV